jgi:hypothetical protein
VLGALVAALALGAVVAGVIIYTNHNSSSSASRSSAGTAVSAQQQSRPASTTVVPSTVTVSVLNGTDTFGLAGRVAERLSARGYRRGQVTNASDQTQTKTLISYMTAAQRRDALAVAAALKLGRGSVQPIDASTKAIACPPTQACTSAVVVTIGRDLASQ